ncbi:MAG: peptidase [Aureispira sp.]|nr:peptidase [Aureispira sp.]
MKIWMTALGACLMSFCSITEGWTQKGVKTFVDIHVNSTLKPFNSRYVSDMEYDIWEPIYHECGAERSAQVMQTIGNNVPKHSQSNLESLAKGNARIACVSLSPIEQRIINSTNYLNEKNKKETISCLTGIVANQLFLRRKEIDYFSDLIENIQYIKRFEYKTQYVNGFPYSYNIIRTKQEMTEIVRDPNRIGLVLTLEGGHILGHSIYINDKITDLEEYKALALENVDRLKGALPITNNSDEYLDIPILWMSLAKTFDNGLGGVSMSLNKSQQSIFGKVSVVNKPQTDIAEDVIDRLLSKEKGRRILIDVKGMSLSSRKRYYKKIERGAIMGDKIPVICSHCGVSGNVSKNPLYRKKDDDSKNNNSYLNHWQQNLSEEDIREIYTSGGLLGISLDKSVIAGQLAINEINNTLTGSLQRRKACVKVIMANMLQVVKSMNNNKAWGIITIGSDFDAMYEPFEPYSSVEQLADLANDIQQFLEKPEDIHDLFKAEEIRELMFDYSPAEIAEKVMSSNALNFIQRNLIDSQVLEAERKRQEEKERLEKEQKEIAEAKARKEAEERKTAIAKREQERKAKKEKKMKSDKFTISKANSFNMKSAKDKKKKEDEEKKKDEEKDK